MRKVSIILKELLGVSRYQFLHVGTQEMLVLRENMSEKIRINTVREGTAKINYLRSNMQCNDRLSPTLG